MYHMHHIPLAVITTSLLLPFAVGCGEIELPTREETPKTEEPATPADDEQDNEKTDDQGEAPGGSSDDGNQGSGNENNGDDNPNDDNPNDEHDADTPSNTAILTADGHILVGNRLYLSIIEYVGIQGDEATKAGETAKKYVEGTLKGWRIPTRNDAKVLTAVLTSETQWYGGSPMAVLNHALKDSDLEIYDLLSLYEGAGDNPSPIYYLSDGGTTAYTYAAGASQPFINVKASKKYRLRLVKDK